MTCTRGCCETNRDHWLSVGVAPSATPTRSGNAAINNREKRWSKDMDAYRRLRNDGEQPASIDGAHRLEREAETRAEIETGRVLTRKQRRMIEDVA